MDEDPNFQSPGGELILQGFLRAFLPVSRSSTEDSKALQLTSITRQ